MQGYGREYRRRLRGTWGITDIDDVSAGAQELVRRGLADKDKLAIDGGSAGGFTTLGALAFKDVFTAVRPHQSICTHPHIYTVTRPVMMLAKARLTRWLRCLSPARTSHIDAGMLTLRRCRLLRAC